MDMVSISGIEERVKGQTPDVLSLNYDLSILRIKLVFPSGQIVYVTCENVEGFKVLDEGQLLEFGRVQRFGICCFKLTLMAG